MPHGTANAARLLAPTAAWGAACSCSVLDVGCGIGDNSLYIARHARKATITACDLVGSAGCLLACRRGSVLVRLHHLLLLPPASDLPWYSVLPLRPCASLLRRAP